MEEQITISLGVTTAYPIRYALELTATAEKNGYTTVWVGDDIDKREALTYMSILAVNIKRINLGSGILSPYIYDVPTLSSAAATIDEILPSDFILGIGVGGAIQVKEFTGKKPVNVLKKMCKTTIALKRIFAGEKISYNDKMNNLKDFRLSFKTRKIPIYFGVRGPKLLALAGEISDGVIFSTSINLLSESIKIVSKAAKNKKRNQRGIKKILWNGFILDSGTTSLNLAKDVVITILTSLPKNTLQALNLKDDFVELLKTTYYIKKKKSEARELIDEELIRRICFHGGIDELRAHLNALQKLGIDEFIVGPPYGENPKKVISKLSVDKIWRK